VVSQHDKEALERFPLVCRSRVNVTCAIGRRAPPPSPATAQPQPVGTPPNAIVFGSGLVTLPQMAKAGFILNVLMVPVIVGLVLLLGPYVFDLQLGVVPAWVR